jgi:hypothetical protein
MIRVVHPYLWTNEKIGLRAREARSTRLRAAATRLRAAATRLRAAATRLRAAATRLRAAATRLRAAATRLRASHLRLRASHLRRLCQSFYSVKQMAQLELYAPIIRYYCITVLLYEMARNL